MQSRTIVDSRYHVVGCVLVACLFFTPLLRQNASAHSAATITVTSPADSGPGTLRQALLDAQSGDTILFDASVFPPSNPVTITLTSGGLPSLSQGGVTIDASNAGVILDGSQLGSELEPSLLDDVSLTIDGGTNVLQNGDFGSGLEHWMWSDDRPGHVRTLNAADFTSAPQSLEVSSPAHAWDAYTYYVPAASTGALDASPYGDMRSPVWLPIGANQRVTLRFKYKAAASVVAVIMFRHNSNWAGDLVQKETSWGTTAWTEVSLEATTGSDINAVAVQLRTRHYWRWISGLYINSDNNIIRGLQIVNFTGDGISLKEGAAGNMIGGDRSVGSGPHGQGNRIAGVGASGISLWEDGTDGNFILGNWIGLSEDGATADGSRTDGIFVCCGATQTTIGGVSPGFGNVISGNRQHGVSVGSWGGEVSHTRIQGNYIGTGGTGAGFLPNHQSGISIGAESHDNIIGGSAPGAGNLITASSNEGIRVDGDNNRILGNRIGLDIDGTRDVRVAQLVFSPAYQVDNTVFVGTGDLDGLGSGVYRSTDRGQTWLPVNNGLGNLQITALAISPGFATDDTLFAGTKDGLYRSLDSGASWTDITPTGADRHILSLAITAKAGADRHVFFGNNPVWTGSAYSGGLFRSSDDGATWTDLNLTGPSGRNADVPAALRNTPAMNGTELLQFARRQAGLIAADRLEYLAPAEAEAVTTVLGTTWRPGVAIALPPIYAPAMNGTVFVGTYAAAGSLYRSDDYGSSFAPVNAGLDGYDVGRIAIPPDYTVANPTLYVTNPTGEGAYPKRSTDNGASWAALTAGLSPDQAKPVDIAFSPNFASDGTLWLTYTYRWPSIMGVFTSTDRGDTWALPVPNIDRRVQWLTDLVMAPDGRLWQATMMDGMLRSDDGGATWVFANGDLTERGNGTHGIAIYAGSGNEIGGSTPADRNIISNNGGLGIGLWGGSTFSTTISGNYIGIDADGLTAAGNADNGLALRSDTHDNQVVGNVIAANPWGGITLNATHDNSFTDNVLGATAAGDKALPQYRGMSFNAGANQNTVADNQIAGNRVNEIGVFSGAWGNAILRNTIGASADRSEGLSPGAVGIAIQNQAANTVVGGRDDGNFIAFKFDGLYVGQGATGTQITHNTIARNTWGLYVGNDVGDVTLAYNTIYSSARAGLIINSGAAPGTVQDNAIYDNGGHGIQVSGATTVRQTLTQNRIYDNGALGIELAYGGNTELSAPVIESFDLAAGTAAGVACANCTVEVFSDNHGEGQWYEGRTTADAAGAWSIAKGSAFTGLEVTATATDAAGNTSEFGQDWPARAPAAPAIAAPICGVTNQPQPQFAGFGQMGGALDLRNDGVSLGSATVNDENEWWIVSATALADGLQVVTATVATNYGLSPATVHTLTVDSTLCYDPVGIIFQQGGAVQHLDDGTGCADPSGALALRLVPSVPTSVTVPARQGPVNLKVNNVDYPLSADDDGQFTGVFTPTQTVTVMVLQLSCGSVQVNATIDPDGFVYDAAQGIDFKLAGAVVHLDWLDAVRNRWVAWPAAVYAQVNPQTTAADGYFSFFVSPGEYRLRVSRPGYQEYVSATITVVDRLVRRNVPLIGNQGLYLPVVMR